MKPIVARFNGLRKMFALHFSLLGVLQLSPASFTSYSVLDISQAADEQEIVFVATYSASDTVEKLQNNLQGDAKFVALICLSSFHLEV